MCHIPPEGRSPVPVVAFPAPPGRPDIAAAVDRYLDSIQAATTRASYAETLAHLSDVVGAASRSPS